MSALEILKAIAKYSQGQDETLRPGIVRFQLELRSVDDAAGLRPRLAALLEADSFSLAPLDPLLPTFYVLQFPGVPRTIAPDRLFAIADALVDALDLVSCTPDIGSTLYAEPDARLLRGRAPESVVTDLYCWSQASAPADARWSVAAVRAPQAWAISPKKGEGVLVAQPDTGVATHPDLDPAALRLDLATDIIGGDANPTDPLDPSVANPGHGTATGSVVVSREGGGMVGAAPGASLVPIRCIEDVKIFDGTPVAAAILHAVKVKADVITMSLGGIYSRSIDAALEVAVKAGTIVMAAAGNCVGFVVYPASDSRVIAVAGVDSKDRPWRGTSYGFGVSVSAPAENVYVARRTPQDGGHPQVSGGQGTSFAVATTAGVAALWVAHFGREAIRAEAARRRITVQDLFRAALEATARKPPRWNSWFYGAGVVDAEALLARPLRDVPAPEFAPTAPESLPEAPASTPVAEVFDAVDRGTDGVDWKRFGAEATFLAADAWRRSSAERSVLVESAVRPQPSPGLAAEKPEVLRRALALGRGGAELVDPLPPPQSARRTEMLIAPKADGRESTAESARASLEGLGLRDLQDEVEKLLAALDADPRTTAEAAGARRDVLSNTESAVRALTRDGEAKLSPDARVTIEAIVRLKGRPSFKVIDGKLAGLPVEMTDWQGLLFAADPFLAKLAAAVGRIDLDGAHIGTGFVVDQGLVMTNRHVAEAIADAVAVPGAAPRWFLRDNVSINFDDRGRGDKLRFAVKGILAAGDMPIGRAVDYAHLDMALLEVETTNAAAKAFPARHPLVGDPDEAAVRQSIAVIGYPARPDRQALDDPSGKETAETIGQRLAAIFGLDYGCKYFSPGELELVAGKVAGDARRWIVTHDATTLAGCSGSAVIRFTDDLPVLGLHFAGRPMTANYAHALGAVRKAGVVPPAVFDRPRWV